MCWFGVGPAGIAWSQGKGSSGLIFLTGDRSLVSIRSIIAVLSVGSFVIRPVSGYRMDEKLGGVLFLFYLSRDSEVLKMDLKAFLGLFMNMASMADP